MHTFVLLFQCRDQRGIVAKISDFILSQQGNIISADQYSTNPEGGHFFIRIEFVVESSGVTAETVSRSFEPVSAAFQGRFTLVDKSKRMAMGLLVSRQDHCLVEMLYLWKSGELAVDIPCVISNYEGHRQTAGQYNVPFYFLPASKEDCREEDILRHVQTTTDFLVLARYMLVLSPAFLRGYTKDILNIHHSFLPSFKGANPYQQAFDQGVKVIGATAHFVTEALDEGPIIAQSVEPVSHRDTVASLRRKGKNIEKRVLAAAVASYIDYRIIKFSNKTIIF